MRHGTESRTSRRGFLKTGAAAAVSVARPASPGERVSEALAAPAIRRELLPRPVTLASVELLRSGRFFLVRGRSTDGGEGVAEGHGPVLESAWPILVRRVAPYFAGKDARDLESLLDGVYLHDSNYKWQGLPFWSCVASVELAILDLLGQVSGRSIGDLLAG
jgi:L-alanine-DL-glutamate epimerase-like enolase superfamily enzyme